MVTHVSTHGFASDVLLSPKKIAKIEKKHWAGGFRRKTLPVLLANEETFRPFFCDDDGRPNKPAAATLGAILFKKMFDLTDEVAMDNFEFNALWQYALHIEPDEAHVCQKTLIHRGRVEEDMDWQSHPGCKTDGAVVRGVAWTSVAAMAWRIQKRLPGRRLPVFSPVGWARANAASGIYRIVASPILRRLSMAPIWPPPIRQSCFAPCATKAREGRMIAMDE